MGRQIRIGVVGFGWMGRVHTQAYRRLRDHFDDIGVEPVLTTVADDVPGRADSAVGQFGFASATTDWRDIAADPSIDAVSITAPNFLHREIAVAMAEAGKRIWIEKPVGLSAADARAARDAAAGAGVASTVGFNYRNPPAVQHHAGDDPRTASIGRVTHVTFRLLSDYAAHPDGALSWRFERERGGNGILGDLMSHGIDLARHLLGDVESLVADTGLFLAERPRPSAATSGRMLATGGELGSVENEDYVSCLLRFASGAKGVIESSRIAVGSQNDYNFEIHGTAGCLGWNFQRMGELRASIGSQYQDQPMTTLFVVTEPRRLRPLPAGRRERRGLRRPQGHRAGRVPPLDRCRHAARRDARRRGGDGRGAGGDGTLRRHRDLAADRGLTGRQVVGVSDVVRR